MHHLKRARERNIGKYTHMPRQKISHMPCEIMEGYLRFFLRQKQQQHVNLVYVLLYWCNCLITLSTSYFICIRIVLQQNQNQHYQASTYIHKKGQLNMHTGVYYCDKHHRHSDGSNRYLTEMMIFI